MKLFMLESAVMIPRFLMTTALIFLLMAAGCGGGGGGSDSAAADTTDSDLLDPTLSAADLTVRFFIAS